MNIEATKIQLAQHLFAIMDEGTLERVVAFFRKEVVIEEDEDDYTEEDIAELDRRREERLQGNVPSHSMEESLRLAREGFKG